MTEVRIMKLPSFRVVGKKVWISGQDNKQFGVFWDECHKDGTIEALRKLSSSPESNITKATTFGVSRVEKDPSNRAFFFYIATETDKTSDGFESFSIPAAEWAVFSNRGELPMSLVDAEIFAYTKWLPASKYIHANAPELEVYPAADSALVEYWLPIVKKEGAEA